MYINRPARVARQRGAPPPPRRQSGTRTHAYISLSPYLPLPPPPLSLSLFLSLSLSLSLSPSQRSYISDPVSTALLLCDPFALSPLLAPLVALPLVFTVARCSARRLPFVFSLSTAAHRTAARLLAAARLHCRSSLGEKTVARLPLRCRSSSRPARSATAPSAARPAAPCRSGLPFLLPHPPVFYSAFSPLHTPPCPLVNSPPPLPPPSSPPPPLLPSLLAGARAAGGGRGQ